MSGHGLTTGAFTLLMVADAGASYCFAEPNGNTAMAGGGGAGAEWEISSDAFAHVLLGGGPATTAAVIIAVFNGASSKLYRSNKAAAANNAGALSNLTGLQLIVSNVAPPSIAGGQAGSTRHFLLYGGALSQLDCEYLLDGFGAESNIAIGM